VSCYIGTTQYYLYGTTSTVSARLWKFQKPSTLGWQPVYFVPVLFWECRRGCPHEWLIIATKIRLCSIMRVCRAFLFYVFRCENTNIHLACHKIWYLVIFKFMSDTVVMCLFLYSCFLSLYKTKTSAQVRRYFFGTVASGN